MRTSARYLVILLLAPLLWACSSSHTTVVNTPVIAVQKIAPDTRTADQIAELLPAGTFEQSEFPKPYVINMVRRCINIGKARRNLLSEAGKLDSYCACIVSKQVHTFKLSEYMQLNTDLKSVPDGAKRLSAINAECLQASLK